MNQSFGGLLLQQTWTALYMLESVLSTLRFECIIELGSGSGALTAFFRLHTNYCLSYDIKHSSREDVFSDAVIDGVKWYSSPYKTLFFCDDGDKPRELKTYLPLVKRGDHIMVHDWKRLDGISPSDLANIDLTKFETYRQPEFDKLKTYILSLRRRLDV